MKDFYLNVFEDRFVTSDGRVRHGVVNPGMEQLRLELFHRKSDAAPVFEA
jgi:hypothetical protein